MRGARTGRAGSGGSGFESHRRCRAPRSLLGWGTLDSYLARRFAAIYAGNLVIFSLLFVLIDAVEHLDDYARGAGGAGEILSFLFRYYAAVLPLVFCQLLGPVVCLATGLFTVTVSERANELVPMLACGRSYRRIFAPLLAAGFAVSGGSFALQELYLPRTVETIREVTGRREGMDVLENQKYLDTEKGLLIVLKRYWFLDRRAEGIAVFPVGRRPVEDLIQARAMRWVPGEEGKPGHWLLEEAVVQRYRTDPATGVPRLVPQAAAASARGIERLYRTYDVLELDSRMTPEDIEMHEEEVVYMTLGELRRKMEDTLDRRWTIKYVSRFAYPLGNVVLLLVGLPVIVMLGGRNVFFGALVAAALAAAYFVAGSLAGDLALRGFLPAPLGGAFAPLAFSALGITLLRYMRT